VGKKLPEARFAAMHLAHRSQKSVYGMFGPKGGESDANGEGHDSDCKASMKVTSKPGVDWQQERDDEDGDMGEGAGGKTDEDWMWVVW
jgi:hypothetical protein